MSDLRRVYWAGSASESSPSLSSSPLRVLPAIQGVRPVAHSLVTAGAVSESQPLRVSPCLIRDRRGWGPGPVSMFGASARTGATRRGRDSERPPGRDSERSRPGKGYRDKAVAPVTRQKGRGPASRRRRQRAAENDTAASPPRPAVRPGLAVRTRLRSSARSRLRKVAAWKGRASGWGSQCGSGRALASLVDRRGARLSPSPVRGGARPSPRPYVARRAKDLSRQTPPPAKHQLQRGPPVNRSLPYPSRTSSPSHH